MKQMKMLMVLFTIIASASIIKAQGQTAVPFLILAPDSRAGGLGESGGGLADNSAGIYWNPAGIAFLTGSEISITHSNWLPQFNLDLFYDYATYRTYVEDLSGSVTASVTYMNFGEFVRTGQNSPDPLGTFRSFDAALTVGYATKLSNDWGLGLNLRLIHSRLSDSGAGSGAETGEAGVATSVSFDIGAMWRPAKFEIPFVGDLSNRFSVGVNIANIGPKIYYMNQAQADPIPTNFRLGFAIRPFEDEENSLTYTLDFQKLLVGINKAAAGDTIPQRDNFITALATSWADEPLSEELRQVVTSMGLEYVYHQPSFQFALRAGMFYEDPNYGNRKFVTLGAGVKYDMYGFDFSYITTDVFKGTENHPLSNTLRFTISMGWGESQKTSLGFPRGI